MSISAFRRRIAPSVPLLIEYTDQQGTFRQTYRVAFNLNVLADISEKTNLSALSFEIWTKLDAKVLRAMLWAALLPNHEEFDTRDPDGRRTDDGIEVIGSWLDGENQEKAARALWEAYLLHLPKDQAELLRKEREKAETGAPATSVLEKSGELPLALDGSTFGPSQDTISESPIAKSAS